MTSMTTKPVQLLHIVKDLAIVEGYAQVEYLDAPQSVLNQVQSTDLEGNF